jgi:hypothetical protein
MVTVKHVAAEELLKSLITRTLSPAGRPTERVSVVLTAVASAICRPL